MKISSLGVYLRPGGPSPCNSSLIICLMSISPSFFFKYFFFLRKNWLGGGELLLKIGTINGYAY